MVFKKRKGHQNKIKSSVRKRKVLTAIALILSLLFGKPRLSFSRSSSSNLDNQVVQERVIEERDMQVINTDGKVKDGLSNKSSSHLIKTGSGILIGNQQISEGSKSALIIRSGNFGKNGPGARAKSDARRNAKAGKFSSGSTIIPDANGFVPHQTYCRYHENAPLSCKPNVKVSDGTFQGDGDNNQPPPEDGKFDASQYKGGPSPFKKYEYEDPAVVAQNIGFTQSRHLNKSYDKHAKDCFGIMGNRNKENLEIFKGDIQNLAQSVDEVYKGSYRYEDPAYIFLKEIDEKMTAVIVNATDGEYITSINPTSGQIEDLESNGNIGLDTRPSMQLTLRLRGPKNSNL
jgi:hypothetical protein